MISHVFLCMLAYYSEYHLRKALTSMLWTEEGPEGKKAQRKNAQRKNAIEPVKRSTQQQAFKLLSIRVI